MRGAIPGKAFRQHARLCAFALLSFASFRIWAQNEPPGIDAFLDAAAYDDARRNEAIEALESGWRDAYAGMLVDLADIVSRTRSLNTRTFSSPRRVLSLLGRLTGQDFGNDLDAWRHWVWRQPYEPHPAYAAFKGQLYGRLDQRFTVFFRPPAAAIIRLDEIQWGGVGVNGIPPLEYPQHVRAEDAGYLQDSNRIFGLVIDGEARAYPQRILAWHELALERFDATEVALVYCTLCGTVIPYDARVGGELRKFGTSGLLYRSNKLMFDFETGSLWSSLTGEPVVGPLAGQGLRLDAMPVVTTTWGEWRALHPDTLVLSIETGHQRDYSEGAAYRTYFGTDELMFDVRRTDGRLRNKAEVLVVREAGSLGAPDDAHEPLAIDIDYLQKNPVYHFTYNGRRLVVVTSDDGANRVYAAGDRTFVGTAAETGLFDQTGRAWSVTEDSLEAGFDPRLRLPRVPAHRAFWFGWFAQHPQTRLIR